MVAEDEEASLSRVRHVDELGSLKRLLAARLEDGAELGGKGFSIGELDGQRCIESVWVWIEKRDGLFSIRDAVEILGA